MRYLKELNRDWEFMIKYRTVTEKELTVVLKTNSICNF